MKTSWKAALSAVLVVLGCDNSAVTETGYFLPGNVGYSSTDVLGEQPSEVLVIGEPGAIEEPGGVLVAGTAQGMVADSGSFVVVTQASLGDELVLRYELDDTFDELSLALDDDLAEVGAATCLQCAGSLFSPSGPDMVEANLAQLDDPTPPFVISNVSRGAVVTADAVSPPPVIAAGSGDRVCVHRVDGSASSPAYCETIP